MTMEKQKRLLAQRANEKKHKPPFVVNASNYQQRVKRRWRLPRGLHSATRQVHRGKPIMPTPGYGSPKEVHGLHPTGRRPVLVHTLAELTALDTKVEGAILASGLGGKKRTELLKTASEKKIPLLNVKDVAKKLSDLQTAFGARTSIRKSRLQEKSKKQEEKKKQAEAKVKKAEKKDAPESTNAEGGQSASPSAE